jgi:hypothetical protein
MIPDLAYELPIVCFVVGMLGAVLGAGCWLCARGYGKRLEAQRDAFELAREKAERDLQRVLSYVPQWMQQTVRVEFELLGIHQTERWRELAQEQQHWQFGQEALRRREWQALLAGLPGQHMPAPVPTKPASPGRMAPAPVRPPTPNRAPEPSPALRPEPELESVAVRPQPEHELSDKEIDALPPDLPAPAPRRTRKLPAPKGPVLRNI